MCLLICNGKLHARYMLSQTKIEYSFCPPQKCHISTLPQMQTQTLPTALTGAETLLLPLKEKCHKLPHYVRIRLCIRLYIFPSVQKQTILRWKGLWIEKCLKLFVNKCPTAPWYFLPRLRDRRFYAKFLISRSHSIVYVKLLLHMQKTVRWAPSSVYLRYQLGIKRGHSPVRRPDIRARVSLKKSSESTIEKNLYY
mgnify:CR=1 FL=1